MYGLLGKKLGHSFSKEIHESITGKEYKLIETDDLKSFFQKNDFKGLNVTIPYKSDVIPFIEKLSTISKETTAVNTIYFKSGKLFGDNTDYYGLDKALTYNDISVTNKNIIILGNGSTSRTIEYYCRQNLAKNIVVLARNPKENEHHFSSVENYKNTDIIFNATPVGMFPNNTDDVLIDLDIFDNLKSVVDAVYNPLRSNLLLAAKNRGLQAVNGLFMLISQAAKSIELMHDFNVSDEEILNLYNKLQFRMSNLVFIGMPMSGKTAFSRLCSERYNKSFIDIDHQIIETEKSPIPEIFTTHGEKYFRDIESSIIEETSKRHNQAISCGGGVILNEQNIQNLKQNGVIIFLNSPLKLLMECNPKDRPLLKDKSNLVRLYNERIDLYHKYADIVINKNTFNKKVIMQRIEVKINEYFGT